MKRPLPWIAALVCAVVGGLVWSPLLELELLGWDSYPMIAAGVVTGPGEVLSTFGEELMDGRYPLGRYWRPLVHLSFALDHALWGLEPFGYHLSDLVLLAASAGLTAALAVRLFGLPPAGALLGGLVAGLCFALHPVHFEILPIAPRRADALAVFFTLLALLIAGGGAPGRRRALLTGLVCALAFMAKETGIVATAAVALLVFVRVEAPESPGSPESLGTRLARTARSLWPAWLPVAAVIFLRTVVLGGLGGSRDSSLTEGLASLHLLAAAYLRRLALPPTFVQAAWAGPATLGAGLVALVLVLFLLRSRGRALGTLVGWALFLLALTSMSGLGHDWYLYPFLPLWGLALGALAGGGWTALAGAGAARRAAGAAALALALALVAVPATASPLLDGAQDFRAASQIERRFLRRFERQVRAATPGTALTLERTPTELFVLDQGGGRTFHRKIYILGRYSLEAYADLVFGQGRVRVHFPGRPSERPGGAGVLDVSAVPAPMGFRPPAR